MVWFHLSLTEGFDGRTTRTVGPSRVLVVPVPRPEPVAVVGKYRLVGEVINKFMQGDIHTHSSCVYTVLRLYPGTVLM